MNAGGGVSNRRCVIRIGARIIDAQGSTLSEQRINSEGLSTGEFLLS